MVSSVLYCVLPVYCIFSLPDWQPCEWVLFLSKPNFQHPAECKYMLLMDESINIANNLNLVFKASIFSSFSMIPCCFSNNSSELFVLMGVVFSLSVKEYSWGLLSALCCRPLSHSGSVACVYAYV